jgi:hypothetical protein
MTYEEQVKIWLAAVEKSTKKILSSKRETLKFMQKVGIVDKTGKQLAKRYR